MANAIFPHLIRHKLFKTSGFRFILAKTRFPVEKHEDESGAWQQNLKLLITVGTRAKSPRFQSSANQMENLSKLCQTFCLLKKKVQQACQTCQTCRFWNWGVNRTQVKFTKITVIQFVGLTNEEAIFHNLLKFGKMNDQPRLSSVAI